MQHLLSSKFYILLLTSYVVNFEIIAIRDCVVPYVQINVRDISCMHFAKSVSSEEKRWLGRRRHRRASERVF
jgi:hypothetical protein